MKQHNSSGFSEAKQLALGLGLNAARRFETFVGEGNESVLAALNALIRHESSGNIYLLGGVGAGKSHLLQACCAQAAAQGERVAYLPLREHAQMNESLLSDLHAAQLICLDDIDAIAGQEAWERSVFRLYNDADAAGIAMVFAGREGPGAVHLADLSSRLSAALLLALRSPDDAHRTAVLRQRAKDLGLHFADEVLAYILARQPRDLGHLTGFIEGLDAYALVEKRRITVALVRAYMASIA